MKNYDYELSIVLDDHGYQQALGLQAKTGRDKSKILKWYRDGTGSTYTLINSDGSVSADKFQPNRWVRLNFIGHGDSASSRVEDTGGHRSWTPEKLATELKAAIDFALPQYKGYKFRRLSMIVCYGGGHTYITRNTYGAIVDPKDSFGYKFFSQARGWVRDMTARGDVSTTSIFMKGTARTGTLSYADFTGAHKSVGSDHARKDKYRKVRFYEEGGQVKVEWPYLGYD
jgi:hypothetical protein